MDDVNKAVEAGAGDGAAPEPSEFEKRLAEKDAEIERLSKEKNNYKKGMLKAKGKLNDDEDDEEESVDEKVARLVQEQFANSQLAKAEAEKDEIIKQALARNKELETAVANRSQISTANAGASSDTKMTPKDPILTEEKIKTLKGMGWDDDKIERYKKNLMKM